LEQPSVQNEPNERVDAVDRYIARLYRSVLAVSPSEYRSWALTRLAQVVPHDAAIWASGSIESFRFHTVTMVGPLPKDFPSRLEATHHINPLFQRIIADLDQPTDMESVLDDEAFHRSELYRQAFKPVGIERILSTAHMDERSGLYSLVTLYRKNPQARFSTTEKDAQRRINFHLFNAHSHAFFVNQLQGSDRPPGSGAAVVDATGVFHEAQPRLLDALDKHFPRRAKPQQLPFALPKAGTTVMVDGLAVKCQPLGDLFLLHIWEAGPLDRLTAREREIVHAVAQGLSFKQAARKIGVAPSTVANHLYRVYRKLGVSSRTELAGLVYPAGD
jgi:DNA-binding CsgD family transcriptional regulator